MSAIASFYIFSKPDFELYCRHYNLVPHNPQLHVVPVMLDELETSLPYESKEFIEVGDYLWSKQAPYEYQWSGWILTALLEYLKESKHIDLTAKTFDQKGTFPSNLIDKTIKDKCLAQLNPSSFNEQELAAAYKHQNEKWMGVEGASSLLFAEQGEAMLDGIKIIYDCLQLVNDETVLVLHIG